MAMQQGSAGKLLLRHAYEGNVNGLTALLSAANEPDQVVMARGPGQETALMVAAMHAHAHCVNILLRYSPEAQVAAINQSGRWALLLAADKGHAKCVQALLVINPGAPSVSNMEKSLHSWWLPRMAPLSVSKRYWSMNAECVRSLLFNPGTQVTTADVMGRTALMMAAQFGHAKCVQILLGYNPGQQVPATDMMGGTALVRAAEDSHAECAQLLLAHGAELCAS